MRKLKVLKIKKNIFDIEIFNVFAGLLMTGLTLLLWFTLDSSTTAELPLAYAEVGHLGFLGGLLGSSMAEKYPKLNWMNWFKRK